MRNNEEDTYELLKNTNKRHESHSDYICEYPHKINGIEYWVHAKRIDDDKKERYSISYHKVFKQGAYKKENDERQCKQP